MTMPGLAIRSVAMCFRAWGWNPSWSFTDCLFTRAWPLPELQRGTEIGLLANSSSAVDCKLTAENFFESS